MREGSWWTAVAGGAIAFPIAVLLHELGHFAGYSVFGFPDPVLSFASTGWADVQFDALIAAGDVEAAAAIAQPWQVAVAGAAGPIVSYLAVIACVLAVRRFGPGPLSLVLGVGLVSPLRWLPAIPLLAVKLVGVQWTTGMDEAKLAERTGIPEIPLLLLDDACLVLGYWFLVTAIPRGQRVRAIVPTLVGALAVGGPLWVLWRLGPLVLP